MVPHLTLVEEVLNQNSTQSMLAPAGWKGKGDGTIPDTGGGDAEPELHAEYAGTCWKEGEGGWHHT
jgi:hypothetical protein